MKKNNYLILTLSALLFALVACGTSKKLQGSAAAPAAQGKLTANKDANGNTDLQIKVKHLAEAKSVSANAENYIVWMQPDGGGDYQNLGALEVDDNLEGKFKTTTSQKDFRIIVTPEPNRLMSRPTGPTIFEETVHR